MLRAFQHEVAAQSGKMVAAAATFLTTSADSVIACLQADQPGAGNDNGNDKGKDKGSGNGSGNGNSNGKGNGKGHG